MCVTLISHTCWNMYLFPTLHALCASIVLIYLTAWNILICSIKRLCYPKLMFIYDTKNVLKKSWDRLSIQIKNNSLKIMKFYVSTHSRGHWPSKWEALLPAFLRARSDSRVKNPSTWITTKTVCKLWCF